MSFNILIVCIGNVCRSPMAERLLQSRLDDLLGPDRDGPRVSSAGVRAMPGNTMDPTAAEELKRLGGSDENFASQQLTEKMVEGADLVLTMTSELRSRVLEDVPSALRRTFTLTELASLADGVSAESPRALVADAAQRRSSAQLDDYDVPDPIGGTPELHREVADLIDGSVRRVAEALTASIGKPSGVVSSA